MMTDTTEEPNDETPKEEEIPLRKILKEFVDSDDALQSQAIFVEILEKLGKQHQDENEEKKKPYQLLVGQDESPRLKTLCQTLDSKTNSSEYKKEARNALKDKKVLIAGAGPCGLRAAIELSLLGLEVVVVEKRDVFTRNSVLQLWLFLVEDLKRIGFKELLPKFGLGDRLHISIRRLQLVLLKIALLLGVDVHLGVEFIKLIEPKKKKIGWKSHCFNVNKSEIDKTLKDYEFDALVIANGHQKEDLGGLGFEWVNIERKLAIAIAANFKNKNNKEDLQVDGTGTQGVMHQLDYFKKLKEEKGTDLENVVYLRDDTHYVVMTAKKENLLERGVLKQDTGKKTILQKSNVDQDKLQEFAKDVAAFCTEEKVPLEFYTRVSGDEKELKPDVDIFEFTSRSHAKQAAVIKDIKGKKPLLIALVGDSLKQPFWPEGLGIAHGFFSVFDTVWTIYEYLGEKLPVDEVLENRKESYSSLKELSKESMCAVKDYGIDPHKRYGKYRHYKTSKAENVASTSKHGPKDKDKGKSKQKKTDKTDQEKQKSVSFGGGKKNKSKDGAKETEEDKEPKERVSLLARFTALFSRRNRKKSDKKEKPDKEETDGQNEGKLKKSASADDIRDVKGGGGENIQRRGRFASFRQSFRNLRRKKEKGEKDKVTEEKEGEGVKKGDASEEAKHTSERENYTDKEESPELKNDVDVKVEVHDS